MLTLVPKVSADRHGNAAEPASPRLHTITTGTDGTPAGGVWLRLSLCVLAIGTTRVVALGGIWDIRRGS